MELMTTEQFGCRSFTVILHSLQADWARHQRRRSQCSIPASNVAVFRNPFAGPHPPVLAIPPSRRPPTKKSHRPAQSRGKSRAKCYKSRSNRRLLPIPDLEQASRFPPHSPSPLHLLPLWSHPPGPLIATNPGEKEDLFSWSLAFRPWSLTFTLEYSHELQNSRDHPSCSSLLPGPTVRPDAAWAEFDRSGNRRESPWASLPSPLWLFGEDYPAVDSPSRRSVFPHLILDDVVGRH